MGDQLQQALRDPDLIRGCVCGLVAAVVMSYVAHITGPGLFHALLGLLALVAILAGFLFVGRAKVEPEWKAAAAIGGGLISVLLFVFLSTLY